jgi:hypothetical protein
MPPFDLYLQRDAIFRPVLLAGQSRGALVEMATTVQPSRQRIREDKPWLSP